MKQTYLNLDLGNRRTRKRMFLDEMERVVPWKEFAALIAPLAPTKATGRKPPSKRCCAFTSCSNGSG
jgi:IS5 family transposase